MREKLLRLLKELERAIPTNGHHSLTFCQYGSDENGWEDRLGLNIRVDQGQQTFFIDDGDLEDPERLIAFIVDEMQRGDRPLVSWEQTR